MSTVRQLPEATSQRPTTENGRVAPPRRRRNAEVRSREHLEPMEVTKLVRAARAMGRYGHRDAALIRFMYRHGLRVSEACALRWDAISLEAATLSVSRLKRGTPSVHPLRGPELRDLREIRREWPDSPYVFCSERGGPLTARTVRDIVARAGIAAKLPMPVHPHMLRHALGYYLAGLGFDTRAIQAYLGHRSITHTVRYTELSPDRFKAFFRD
ncbi:MAG: tyrosine-type recombinase/integrase [Steroidobacteraceae bacterium]